MINLRPRRRSTVWSIISRPSGHDIIIRIRAGLKSEYKIIKQTEGVKICKELRGL